MWSEKEQQKSLQRTLSLTDSMRGTSVAELLASHLYTAPLSDAFVWTCISADTERSVTVDTDAICEESTNVGKITTGVGKGGKSSL